MSQQIICTNKRRDTFVPSEKVMLRGENRNMGNGR